jgi:hypothetical protein
MATKFTYFFRSDIQFFDFITRYPKLKNVNVKNEELMIFNFRKNTDIHLDELDLIINSNIIIISSEIIIFFLIDLLKFHDIKKNLLYKKILLVGKSLKKKIINEKLFSDINIECFDSIFDIRNYLDNNFKNFETKKIIYLRGEKVKLNFFNKNIFINESIIKNFNELIVYDVDYKNKFSEAFLYDFKSNLVKNIVFFSLESLKNFLDIMNNDHEINQFLKLYFRKITIFLLGDFFLDKNIKKYEFKNIFIAKKNNSENFAKIISDYI